MMSDSQSHQWFFYKPPQSHSPGVTRLLMIFLFLNKYSRYKNQNVSLKTRTTVPTVANKIVHSIKISYIQYNNNIIKNNNNHNFLTISLFFIYIYIYIYIRVVQKVISFTHILNLLHAFYLCIGLTCTEINTEI